QPIIPATPPPVTNRPVTPPPQPPAALAPQPATGATGSTGSSGSSGTDRGADRGSGSTATGGGSAPATADAAVIEVAKDAAQTYDPLKRAGAEFGPAANAVDDDPKTVWDVVVPADNRPIAAGLVIDLGKPYALRSLRLATPTEGFTVEIYGAKSAKQLPQDVIDKRWIHLTNVKSAKDGGLVVLKGKGDGAKVRLVLLHFTKPAEPADPRVAIGDVQLRGTP
ncbi:MAG TPA: hypothetical protein VG474_01310, partial [Solirubrobacteraceae bacterium]|nr:hypothetical protein [Solirubrobacteraceae bacterium]